jgi:transposase
MEDFIMSRQFTKEFKEDAVRYYEDHNDLGLTVCAKNLGVSRTALDNSNT